MTGKQHAVIGAVCGAIGGVGLTVLNPPPTGATSIASIITQTIIGGVVGALIVDIDSKKSIASQKVSSLFVGAMIFFALTKLLHFTVLDKLTNIAMSHTVKSVYFIAFAILVVLGKLSPHRQFTHKFFGTLLFCIVSYLMLPLHIAIGFSIGYMSHVFADMTTPAGLNWLDFKLPMQNAKGKLKASF